MNRNNPGMNRSNPEVKRSNPEVKRSNPGIERSNPGVKRSSSVVDTLQLRPQSTKESFNTHDAHVNSYQLSQVYSHHKRFRYNNQNACKYS